MSKSQQVLGLDLGPNSIGWALIREGDDDGSELINAGVRVFPEGVDAFDTSKERSRNEDRRIARSMRRQVRRRVERRRKLVEALIESGLWPAGSAPQQALYERDPWELRKKGLSEKLEPHEIGRVILHLNQRRGFLSNRKRDRGDKEAQGMLAEINQNEAERQEKGHKTIGSMLEAKLRTSKEDHTANRSEEDERKVRGRHLSRKMIFEEFDAIWNAHAKHHPDLLTSELRWGTSGPREGEQAIKPHKPIAKHAEHREGDSDLHTFGLHGLLFFHRPVYWPKSVVGLCEFEPKQRRCPKADRHAERFRLLTEVNNLRYADTEANEEVPLNDEQRTLLLNHLATREDATFDQIRKKLGFLESVKFNLERGKRPKIKGMVLDWKIANTVGKDWHERPESEKDAVVVLLRENESDDDHVVETLINEYGFSAEDADSALDIDIPTGYGSLSRKAIDKMLPYLEQGMIYQSVSDPEQSALHAAGYLRRDELQRRLFDHLPDLERVDPATSKLGDMPNPVVKRALTEIRKVVNAIIREHGKPDAVHVEMARDLAMGSDARSEFNSQMRKNESERDEAANAIRNMGERPSRDAILKYRLWQQQSHECVYCGKTISQNQLFGGATDVDHILPYSRSLDDAQSNKVVCHRECNHDKGQQTPYEWLADSNRPKYDAICQRVGTLLRKGLMHYGKYRRFLQKELKLDDFIARQLNDTGYITRATVEYLQLLFDKPSQVLGLKGQLTAELRWQWGLQTVLSELPDSPAWQEQGKLRDGEKNRADHRHHMIDAIVIALTNRSRLRKLSELVRKGGAQKHGEILPDPWEGFRNDVVKHTANINVSHRVERNVRGALHEETLYGPTENPEEWVVRKPVADLSPAEVERIRDNGIRRIVLKTLEDQGIEFGRGKKPNAKQMKAALSNLKMPSGVPINKVRLIKPEKTIAPLREEGDPNQAYVKPGSTHHLCIFEFEVKGKKKRDAVFVTMLEATQRLKRQKQRFAELYQGPAKNGTKAQQAKRREALQQAAAEHPLIQRDATRLTGDDREKIPAEAKFIMSLSSRELVLAQVKGEEKLLQFKTAVTTNGQLRFVDQKDARRSSEQKLLRFTATSLDARKVTVDPLGRIRWAND